MEETLKAIELPEGMRWVEGDGVPNMQSFSGGCCAWLLYMTPATGPEGQGVKMFAHRVDFVPDTSDVRGRVAYEVEKFQRALVVGTATEIKDGEELP